ncbi:unnamed protein product [Phytomonas sp. EM1]|nr:unnamed protein product [Phytomonas sp. EM1]|eukprot:CCW60408.1 unnamed protein product [Phytomonas sp. isolate EM1]
MPSRANEVGLQPRSIRYEWGGPIGAFFMVFFLPILVLALNSLCGKTSCSLIEQLSDVPELVLNTLHSARENLLEALIIEVFWICLHAVFYLCPIGRMVEGMPLRNGKALSYRINAIQVFILCHVVLIGLAVAGIINLAYLTDIFPSLMLASILISTVMSVILYGMSFRSSTVLTALGGNSGNPIYDFWMGRELNPRSGFLDWKFMCELRPGLIGWSILNWSHVLKSVQLGTLTPGIVLIALFESLYVVDGLLMEAGNLTMMDIVSDGFGFMLCFGDLTWVPFIYTLKTKYLLYHPVSLTPGYTALCVVLVVVGYTIFRGANTQKDRFRNNPSDPRVRCLRTMRTSKGKSLIISGYWGVCRHPNYVGDWLMTLGLAALCGVQDLLPYFHPIYFAFLLIHRQLRDEEQMMEKYGKKDWDDFCELVPCRLIPGVY